MNVRLAYPPIPPFFSLPGRPPVWNHGVSANSGGPTTGLLREFIRKYRRTKDLEVKIRETKHLGPIARRERGAVCMACAGTIMKQVNCAAQGHSSHLSCGFL